MMTHVSWRRLALGVVGAAALATSSQAAPVLSSTVGVKAAVSDHVTDVRWRRGGVAAGIAAGVLAGAAIGAATAPYYGGYGYYGYPAYGYSYPAYGYSYPAYDAYAYSPGYYGAGYGSYAYPTQTCGVYGGYGRWDYSQC